MDVIEFSETMASMTMTPVRKALRACLVLFLLCAAGAVCAGGIAGCDDAPNTQRLPIGTRCADDGTCGTTPYVCVLSKYPGGYCARPCTTDGDCPLDSICAQLSCRRKCVDDSTCRKAEGYVCRTTGATAPYCDIPVSTN